jgi:Family of unknown function (DUF5906)
LSTNDVVTSSAIVALATNKFDRDAIEQHFVYLHHAAERATVEGKLVLAVYGEDPDTRERFAEVRHFQVGDHEGMTAAAMEFDGVPHRNVYTPLAVMRPDLKSGKKGGEGDVVVSLAFVIDGDADKGLDRPTSPLPADYIIESSAGNLQEFLFLDRPLPPDEAKEFGRALQRATKAEFADDISHVWRVPGTLNWPNGEKVHKRGRSRVPQPVRIHHGWSKWTNVEDLRKVLKDHWEEPRHEPLTPRGKHDVCPDKARDFHARLRDAGYYDRDPDDLDTTRKRWIHAAKALSYDLGDQGRAIFEEIVCWKGKREDEGTAVDPREAEYRWRECSRMSPRAKPITHGSIIKEAKTLYGWKGAQIYLDRDKTAKEIFDGVGQHAAASEITANGMPLTTVESPSVVPSDPLPEHPNLTAQQAVALEDFHAYLPGHTYIFTPTGEMWPASSVNSRVPAVTIPMREKPIPAASWLDKNRAVEQMTWAPGKPSVIDDKLIADGGWFDRPGCKTFNLYRPPTIKPQAGDSTQWIDHVKFVFGDDDARHIINWFAHRVQYPDQKINHALVFGGAQGVGKDTLIEPVKQAVGPWNFAEVSPQQMLGRFNPFVKSVILRVSEARDLGDTDRFGFYEHTKAYTAAPPDVLRVDEKHMREHAVLNVCGVIITTNNKDSLHLPGDDRRHFVTWSTRKKEDFPATYWTAIYRWFANGGIEIVAHYLATLDISGFDPKAPPPKTPAFWEIVDSSRSLEDAEMADALDKLGSPPAITLGSIVARAAPDFADYLRDRRNRRKIPHRLDECGYVPVRNSAAKDGLWVITGKRQAIYAKRELPLRDQLAAAEQLTNPIRPPPPPPY